jgi:hypothetical protein
VAWMADQLGTSVPKYRLLGRDYVGSERAALAEAKADSTPPELGIASVDALVETLADNPKRAWTVHRYFREMRAVLAECARVVRPGGHVVLVVCPSSIRQVTIPTHRILVEVAAELHGPQLDLVALEERTLHDRRRVMPYMESRFGQRMRTEYVLVLQRRE